MEYTTIIQKTEDGWYVGQCEQVPEAISQGETLDELIDNMKSCIKEAILMRKEEMYEKYLGKKVFRRKIAVA